METERWQHQVIDAEWDEDGKLEDLHLTTTDGKKTRQPVEASADSDSPDQVVTMLNTFGDQGWRIAHVESRHLSGGEEVRRIWLQRRTS